MTKRNKLWPIPVAVGLVLAAVLAWYTRPVPFSQVLEGVDMTISHRVYLSVRTFPPVGEGEGQTTSLSAWSGTEEYDELMAFWTETICRKDLETLIPRDYIIYEGEDANIQINFTVIDAGEPTGSCYLTVGTDGLIAFEPSSGQTTFYRLNHSPRQALLDYIAEYGEVQ